MALDTAYLDMTFDTSSVGQSAHVYFLVRLPMWIALAAMFALSLNAHHSSVHVLTLYLHDETVACLARKREGFAETNGVQAC